MRRLLRLRFPIQIEFLPAAH
ncbi:MAG: hypothetical protein RL277_1936, partial [Planctomycetota bacterium]